MTSIYDRISAGEFDSKLPYSNDPKVRRNWMDDRDFLFNVKFREALEKIHNVSDHPKAEQVFLFSKDACKNVSLRDVARYYEKIVQLIK